MSNTSFPKHHASSSIEDLSEQFDRSQHNWLLTYLDVFVLIIMLVITLMSLKDFQTDKESNPPPKQIALQPKNTVKIDYKQSELQKVETPSSKVISEEQFSLPEKQVDPQQSIVEKTTIPEDSNHDQGKKTIPSEESNKNKLQEQLTKKIKELGLNDAVDMKVTLGYAQLEIQDKILFKSSEAKLLEDGESVLKKLAPLLAQSLGLIFIEGHTDNRPIKTNKFPSNWELGATRATNVLRYLLTQNIEPSRLKAVSSGATKPIADNSTIVGRDKNRRVSIMIQVSDKIN